MKRGIKLNDLPLQIRKKVIAKNNIAIPPTNMESNNSNALQGKNAFKGLDTRCSIKIHSRRKTLTDADGICAKYLIDSVRRVGILKNDSPKYVKEVSDSQEKISKSESEMTIIDFFES